MSATTRVNGLGHARDVLYSTLQLKVFKIVVDNEETNLTTGIGGQVEKLAQEFGTTAALLEADAETVIFIGDGHALDIDTVAIRAANALGVSSTLTGSGTTASITVTTPTSMFGM
jgi:hypothetical protein